MIEISTNEKGQQVYKLDHITDIALLPDRAFDHLLKEFETLFRSLRFLVVAAELQGMSPEEIQQLLPKRLIWTDDDDNSIKHQVSIGEAEENL